MVGCVKAGLFLLLLAAATPAPGAAGESGRARFALLVGINQYAEPVRPLAGAENDVDAVREVLVARWGHAPERIRVLKGVDANRLGVLNAVTGILTESKPGDEVFVFFAGHGTSAADPSLGAGLPHTTGALVPSDFSIKAESMADELIVGRRDLRPLLEALDRGGRRVFVAIDACYSGNTVRGRYLDALGRPPLPSRSADPVAARFAGVPAAAAREPYPYRNVVYLSAAAEHEVAGDIPADYLRWYPTRDGKPHGAFTDALLRAMHGELPDADRDRDGAFSYAELHAAVSAFMATRGYPQTPQLLPAAPDGGNWIAQAPLLGRASAPATTARPAAADKEGVGLRLVGFTAEERARLLAVDGVREDETAPRFVLLRDGARMRLVSQSGDQVADAAGDGRELVALAVRRARFDALAEAAARGGAAWLSAGTGLPQSTFVAGESVSVSVRLDRPGRLLLLNLDPAGAVNLLYPLFDAERRELPAGRQLRLDGSRVVEPFGHDTVYAFVLDDDAALPLREAREGTVDPARWASALAAAAPRAGGSLVLVTTPAR